MAPGLLQFSNPENSPEAPSLDSAYDHSEQFRPPEEHAAFAGPVVYNSGVQRFESCDDRLIRMPAGTEADLIALRLHLVTDQHTFFMEQRRQFHYSRQDTIPVILGNAFNPLILKLKTPHTGRSAATGRWPGGAIPEKDNGWQATDSCG